MRNITKLFTGLVTGLLALSVAGCAQINMDAARNLIDQTSNSIPQTIEPNSTTNSNTIIPEWNISDYPDYYKVLGKADFTGVTMPQPGTITYATPDTLHRSGKAIGVITKQLRDHGSNRERTMPDSITGWPVRNPKVQINLTGENACSLPKTIRPKNSCYSGYLFNKSHLIAKSLGGEDIAENMVTGTRTQNVGRNQPAGGMAYTETLARNWLDDHPTGTIAYMATPVYQHDELLPRYVLVDIRSSDASIDQHVVVWNTVNGFTVNYQNGNVIGE